MLPIREMVVDIPDAAPGSRAPKKTGKKETVTKKKIQIDGRKENKAWAQIMYRKDTPLTTVFLTTFNAPYPIPRTLRPWFSNKQIEEEKATNAMRI